MQEAAWLKAGEDERLARVQREAQSAEADLRQQLARAKQERNRLDLDLYTAASRQRDAEHEAGALRRQLTELQPLLAGNGYRHIARHLGPDCGSDSSAALEPQQREGGKPRDSGAAPRSGALQQQLHAYSRQTGDGASLAHGARDECVLADFPAAGSRLQDDGAAGPAADNNLTPRLNNSVGRGDRAAGRSAATRDGSADVNPLLEQQDSDDVSWAEPEDTTDDGAADVSPSVACLATGCSVDSSAEEQEPLDGHGRQLAGGGDVGPCGDKMLQEDTSLKPQRILHKGGGRWCQAPNRGLLLTDVWIVVQSPPVRCD